MTTSNNQEKQIPKKKLYLLLGIVAVSFLIGSLAIQFQRTSPISPTGTSSSSTSRISPTSTSSYSAPRINVSTVQINVPTVQYPTIPPSAPEFTAQIHSIGSSGITGTVTFKDIAGTVAILLHIDGPPENEESEELIPVELRYGTCTAPGPLAYPMAAPDAGESETDLSINLQQFNTQRPMAVILYRSPQDHTAIACGDIP